MPSERKKCNRVSISPTILSLSFLAFWEIYWIFFNVRISKIPAQPAIIDTVTMARDIIANKMSAESMESII